MKVRITDINLSELDDADDYYHCKIEQSASGVIQLMPMPYRAAPFPKVAVKLHTYMRHPTENKVWAIGAGGKYTFFSNDKTDFNLVCCEINDTASISDRVDGKLEKGYFVDKSINIYDADERNLV